MPEPASKRSAYRTLAEVDADALVQAIARHLWALAPEEFQGAGHMDIVEAAGNAIWPAQESPFTDEQEHLSKHPFDYPPEDTQQCGAQDDGWYCTRDIGHKGRHWRMWREPASHSGDSRAEADRG